MPHFMMKLKYSHNAVKAMVANPSDRPNPPRTRGGVGATLKGFYFALGDTDLIVIYEAPDSVSAAALAMSLGASGAASDVETSLLLTMEEAMEAMKKAGVSRKRPPAAVVKPSTGRRSQRRGADGIRGPSGARRRAAINLTLRPPSSGGAQATQRSGDRRSAPLGASDGLALAVRAARRRRSCGINPGGR